MQKRLSLLTLLVLLCPMAAWSGPVDVETARQQATDFFLRVPAGRQRHVASSFRMRLLHAQHPASGAAPLLYVFAPEDGPGYAIVAGEDIDTPVLGYSDTAEFPADSIPADVQYWLDEYSRQLAYLRMLPDEALTPARKSLYKPEIKPLTTSKWNQGSPYNALCPIDQQTKYRCVTGCVATAMAQLMYYHQWPTMGAGSHSYECQGQTLTANFGKTAYQWGKMKDTYWGNDDENDAVATLMFHCGVAVDMDYHSGESSAGVMASILQQYFCYASTAHDVSRDAVGDSLFEEELYADLAARRPVLFSGSRADYSGGHEFICDGYRNGYFHFNLGWSGSRDGYFSLGAIIPAGTTYNFSYNQYAICGLQRPGEVFVQGDIAYELYPDDTAIFLGGLVDGDYSVPSEVSVEGRTYTVVSIGKLACFDCPELTSVTIPATVTSVGDSAFYNCPSLRRVTLEESAAPISFGLDVFDVEETGSPTGLEELAMGRTIADGAPFGNARNLSSVVLGNQVTELGYNCFWACSNLEHLVLPVSCRIIREGALAYCEKLWVEVMPDHPCFYVANGVLFQREGNVLLHYPVPRQDVVYAVPEGVAEIGEYAMTWAPLGRLTLPSTLKRVGWAALWLFQLEDIVCLNPTPPTSPSTIFPAVEDMWQKPTLHVPQGALVAYQAKKPWNQFDIREDAEAVGIEDISAATSDAESIGGRSSWRCLTPDGLPLSTPRRGITIMQMDDGMVKKVFVR